MVAAVGTSGACVVGLAEDLGYVLAGDRPDGRAFRYDAGLLLWLLMSVVLVLLD